MSEKEKHSYIFPNLMAKMMKKINMQTQMEASMMSMFLIMISLTFMCFYLVFFGEGSIFYRILLLVNLGCGFIVISSFLVTAYHQYINYMEMMGIDPSKHKEEIRKRGNILKRIYLAIKIKRKAGKTPEFVNVAVERMIEIKQQEIKDMKTHKYQALLLKKHQAEKDLKEKNEPKN